jgi:hypothetical protein
MSQPHQRMQPHPISTPVAASQRVSPYSGAPHNTPPPHTQSTSPYVTPQTPLSNQQHQAQAPLAGQAHNQQQAPIPQGQQTPQTPSFPPNAGAPDPNAAMATPMNSDSESRERERVSLLLDINRELLIEAMRIQAEQKKEATATDVEPAQGDQKSTDKPPNSSAAAGGKEFHEYAQLRHGLGHGNADENNAGACDVSKLTLHTSLQLRTVLTNLHLKYLLTRRSSAHRRSLLSRKRQESLHSRRPRIKIPRSSLRALRMARTMLAP